MTWFKFYYIVKEMFDKPCFNSLYLKNMSWMGVSQSVSCLDWQRNMDGNADTIVTSCYSLKSTLAPTNQGCCRKDGNFDSCNTGKS